MSSTKRATPTRSPFRQAVYPASIIGRSTSPSMYSLCMESGCLRVLARRIVRAGHLCKMA